MSVSEAFIKAHIFQLSTFPPGRSMAKEYSHKTQMDLNTSANIFW